MSDIWLEILNGDRIVTLGLLICCAGRATLSACGDFIVKIRKQQG